MSDDDECTCACFCGCDSLLTETVEIMFALCTQCEDEYHVDPD